MNYTQNYQLPQWEKDDRIMMADFNESNQKIEAAINSKCEIVFGTYVGDGTATRVIDLGFRPKLVILTDENGIFNTTSGFQGGVAVDGAGSYALAVCDEGFTVYLPGGYSNVQSNMKGSTYLYAAFRAV